MSEINLFGTFPVVEHLLCFPCTFLMFELIAWFHGLCCFWTLPLNDVFALDGWTVSLDFDPCLYSVCHLWYLAYLAHLHFGNILFNWHHTCLSSGLSSPICLVSTQRCAGILLSHRWIVIYVCERKLSLSLPSLIQTCWSTQYTSSFIVYLLCTSLKNLLF